MGLLGKAHPILPSACKRQVLLFWYQWYLKQREQHVQVSRYETRRTHAVCGKFFHAWRAFVRAGRLNQAKLFRALQRREQRTKSCILKTLTQRKEDVAKGAKALRQACQFHRQCLQVKGLYEWKQGVLWQLQVTAWSTSLLRGRCRRVLHAWRWQPEMRTAQVTQLLHAMRRVDQVLLRYTKAAWTRTTQRSKLLGVLTSRLEHARNLRMLDTAFSWWFETHAATALVYADQHVEALADSRNLELTFREWCALLDARAKMTADRRVEIRVEDGAVAIADSHACTSFFKAWR
ncbi:hypothetical protein CYMTET_29263, partial [Cymbomonas tetramitiformis]